MGSSAAASTSEVKPSEVAVAAVQAGAHLVNDVSGGQFDDAMHRRVAELGAPYIAMHMRGTPKTMQSMAVYSDLVGDVRRELHECVTDIVEAGVPLWDIIVDPGIGFAKTGDHNLQLLRQAVTSMTGQCHIQCLVAL